MVCLVLLLPSVPAGAASAPPAPRTPTATPGSAQATVRWAAPSSTNGSAITGYVVSWYASGTIVSSISAAATARTLAITGLVNGRTYTFRVAARNAIGTGPLSSPSAPIVVGAPTAPRSPTATVFDAGADLFWKPPASSNAAPVSGYTVSVYTGTTLAKVVTFNSPSTRELVQGLTNGVTYSFKVAAQNNFGVSSLSSVTAKVSPSIGSASGVQFDCNSSNWSDTDRQTVLDTMWASGVRWVRIKTSWSSIEPTTKGTFNLTRNDQC